MTTLAREGGTPVRTQPFPDRRPFGLADAQQVLEALNAGGQRPFDFGCVGTAQCGDRNGVLITIEFYCFE